MIRKNPESFVRPTFASRQRLVYINNGHLLPLGALGRSPVLILSKFETLVHDTMLPGQLAELELSYWGATKQSYLSNKEIAERSDLADDGAKNVFLQALQHLKEAPPKTQREQISPHPDFWNAVCSLDILSILLYRLVSLRRMVPPATFIFGSIKEDFQHVYKWTICAETRLRGKLEVDGSKHHYQLCDKLRYFIFHCLVRLGDNLGKVPPQHPLRMTNSDELDTLMGRLWYLQCRNWSLDPQNLSFSPWLTRTGDRAQRESSRGILYIDEVVNMMKVTPYQFVEAVLFEMDRRCYSAAPDSILVFGVASLFPMFTSSLRLRKAMRIHDGVRRVAAAYRQLSHVRYNEDEDKLDWYSVQYQMMTWVIGFINAVDGITDLRFLLEAKFLTSLFRLHVQRFQFYPVMLLGSDGKPFSTAPLERAYAVFFRHCVHFAIHRSILREVYKAIITVERKGGLMGELEEDASIFEELWMDMRDSIAYRCQAYEVWPILQIQCHRGDVSMQVTLLTNPADEPRKVSVAPKENFQVLPKMCGLPGNCILFGEVPGGRLA